MTVHKTCCLMDSVGETTYVKAEETGEIMASMWPKTMQALLRTDRRDKLRDPRQIGILLGSTTLTTGVFLKEHTFADLNHLRVLLKPDNSSESESHLPQHSNQQVTLRELYSDKQAKSLSLLQQKLRVLNIRRQEAEKELLDDQLASEPIYKTELRNEISSKTERTKQVLQESQAYCEEEEETLSSRNFSESAQRRRQQKQKLVDDEGEEEEKKKQEAQHWRQKARALSKLLSESTKREAVLSAKLEALDSLPKPTSCSSAASSSFFPQQQQQQQQSHLEQKQQQWQRHQQQQLRQDMRNCCDSYLRFALRNAPIVVGHQDMELRYRFIYNAFPSLTEEEVIGKTDMEIYNGKGVVEFTEFKREVLRKGWPENREIAFDTDLFGAKTFLVAVEPVYNASGAAVGINYWAMDVTEQADKRERMASLREQVAVQKAMETELKKTIHITEETMQAKEMLVTMSHEIRSPLSGVVSVAEVLATTDLDAEQRQLVDVMVSSGDLVLQLINNILDLSKVQSGAMKFEAKKFQPREVVKHVLQMAHASVKNKNIVLEADIHDNVPFEVIGDMLRIHQVFINLVSNAIKFTHNGGVTIAVRVVSPDLNLAMEKLEEKLPSLPWLGSSTLDVGLHKTQIQVQPNPLCGQMSLNDLSNSATTTEEVETIWLHCDIHDTGIGIPDEALPTLFDKYTQFNTNQNYGGTGLGLAICKNLVALMGGTLNVTSKENVGSTFSFRLPLQVAKEKTSDGACYKTSDEQDIKNRAHEDLTSANQIGCKQVPSKSGHRDKASERNALAPVMDIDSAISLHEPKFFMPRIQTLRPLNPLYPAKDLARQQASKNGFSVPVGETGAISTDSGAPQSSGPHRVLRILLAEDNKVNVMVAQSMLKRLGHTLETVGNGAEVIQALQRSSYDLILMDIHMPLMNGIEATKWIRRFEKTGSWTCPNSLELSSEFHKSNALPSRIPIVAMTANALPDNREECFQHGMDSFIAKPVTFTKLEQVLKQLFPW